MSARRNVPDVVLGVQRETSDPAVSAWVAANAGSGKTHVLAQRVIRLLLDGTDPAKILCLTYTKAAAANMAQRVFGTLAAWATLDDAALDAAVRDVDGKKPGAARRVRARRLFAEALETPGGLKIQTIHAFCTRILHQFPFEADVAARFAVLEERTETELLDRLRLQVLLDAAAAPDGALGRALGMAIVAAADSTFGDVVREAIRHRRTITDGIARAGSVAGLVAVLSQRLGVAPEVTPAAIDAEIADGPILPAREWPAVAAVLAAGTKTDAEQAERLRAAAVAEGEMRAKAYRAVFLTSEFAPRKRIVTTGIAKQHPVLAGRLGDEQQRLLRLVEMRNAVVARERTAALVTVAAEVIARYQAEKNERGLLDFDDLIDKTLTLLERVDAAWVHYKLDLGIDHVLIDEAQDTSPRQWAIIRHLVSEFTVGEGARDGVKRTIFAVGDEKQSIYSFQGADPAMFADMRTVFRTAHETAGLAFVPRAFNYSFRSGPNVLQAVDVVFGPAAVHRSVTSDTAGIPPHQALPDAVPGLVEIWPLAEPQERADVEPWDAPFDEPNETSPRVRLARRIARTIRGWLDRRMPRDGGAPIRPGDILVLVRQRGALFEAIIRALKDQGVAVAGADRLVLTEHIAIMDLMVLADALLLPEDDLALATVLKSPLIGLDEEQLFTLAWRRPGSLRMALRDKAGGDPALAAAAAAIDRLAVASRRETPFSFYARLLGSEGGRARILARLGHEAADALDEFLDLALDYERRETPTLQGFVAWLRAGTSEIKRDMELGRDEVRVMTAHGAKGLEAPIVILADTTTPPAGPRLPRLLAVPAGGAPDTPDLIVWAGSKDADAGPMGGARGAAQKAAEDEYRRLLYVAMTRAAERLIVCGARGANRPPAGCWYDLVDAALGPDAASEPADDGDGEVLRWRRVAAVPPPATAPPEPVAGAPGEPMPDWLGRTAPLPPAPVAVITPSDAGARDGSSRPRAAVDPAAERHALARGRLVHRLMQSLPEIAPERRAETARRHLARHAADWPAPEQDALVAEVLRVLDDPRLAPLFGPASRAEVAIVGQLTGDDGAARRVVGQIDRLAVAGAEVMIVDYKTNRPAPRSLAEVPAEYVAQLACYRAVLQKRFPSHAVRAGLVFTDMPDFMEISTDALDAALRQLGVTPP